MGKTPIIKDKRLSLASSFFFFLSSLRLCLSFYSFQELRYVFISFPSFDFNFRPIESSVAAAAFSFSLSRVF